ncbi:hypothetical protein BJX76DRAFT_324040 [Aspergillus varians]
MANTAEQQNPLLSLQAPASTVFLDARGHGTKPPRGSGNSPNTHHRGNRPTGVWNSAGKAMKSVKTKMCTFFLLAVVFFAIHTGFVCWLDHKAVKKTINQEWSATISNILAIFFETFLLAGIGIAYDQILWRVFRRRSLRAAEIDSLASLVSTPWDLAFWYKHLGRAPLAYIVAGLAAGIPFAAMFPPAALTTEFRNVVDGTLSNVPTMNISDYGSGNYRNFVEHSFFEMNGDLSFLGRLRPKLTTMASQVLASGGPVKLDSPCGSSCAYSISLDGPRFHCEDRGPDDALMDDCLMYQAEDMAQWGVNYTYVLVNNSFKISWYPKPQLDGRCDLQSRRTLDCSVTLTKYKLDITNSQDDTQSIITEVENDRPFWDDDAFIQAQFYYYFFNNDSLLPEPAKVDELYTNFTHAQAYAISRAAVQALEGQADLTIDGFGDGLTVSFARNASKVLGSPYIGLDDRYNPQFNISAESIERYLQDVVISTISLNSSTHNGDIPAKFGGQMYLFSAKLHLFAGYGSCLVVTLVIYAFALRELKHNGGQQAASGFLDFGMAISASNRVREIGENHIAGDSNASKDLEDIRLRFGVPLGKPAACYAFGTEDELKPRTSPTPSSSGYKAPSRV